MRILGIETSCDETAAAIVKDGNKIISNIVSSQVNIHTKFGGVVPELACRSHMANISAVINQALEEADMEMNDLDGIAVTVGPGLVGALLIGVNIAKAIAYSLHKSLMPVNHLEGHLLSIFLEEDHPEFPYVALIISGGHTDLYFVEDFGNYKILGRTRDDAVGESFDKVARMLDLGYPGGPVVEELAKSGLAGKVNFPRPMQVRGNPDFSFSGLKTSVRNYLEKNSEKTTKADVAAEFQQAVLDVLSFKSFQALDNLNCSNLVMAGGVAANNFLRENITKTARQKNVNTYIPNHHLCTDNAAMIACAGYFQYIKKNDPEKFHDFLELDACANLKL